MQILPHNIRIFSRMKSGFSIGVMSRFIVIVLLASCVAAVLSAVNNTPDSSSTSGETLNSNYYLNEALKSLSESGSENRQDATRSLSIALSLDPANPYALKLYKTLDAKNGLALGEQISETTAIINERPDYAAAWLRLSILYGQTGEEELAKKALERARALNISW